MTHTKKYFIIITLCAALHTAQAIAQTEISDPDYVLAIDKQTLASLENVARTFGGNIAISLRELPPVQLTVDAETYQRFVSLSNVTFNNLAFFGKVLLGCGFALIGGLIIKNGFQTLNEKDKERTALIQIIGGAATVLASLLYIKTQKQ